jgi:two-component system response regulator HydG
MHAIERAVILTRGEEVDVADLPEAIRAAVGAPAGAPAPAALVVPLGTPMEEIERLVIRKTLEQTKGDKNLAAQILGIAARTIYRKLDRDESGRLVEQGPERDDET